MQICKSFKIWTVISALKKTLNRVIDSYWVLKEEIPAAAHIMVVGSKMKFLNCLITLRTVVSHFAHSV